MSSVPLANDGMLPIRMVGKKDSESESSPKAENSQQLQDSHLNDDLKDRQSIPPSADLLNANLSSTSSADPNTADASTAGASTADPQDSEAAAASLPPCTSKRDATPSDREKVTGEVPERQLDCAKSPLVQDAVQLPADSTPTARTCLPHHATEASRGLSLSDELDNSAQPLATRVDRPDDDLTGVRRDPTESQQQTKRLGISTSELATSANSTLNSSPERPVDGPTGQGGLRPKLHRIREVREQQGISVRSMARRMNIDIRSYRRLEEPTCDLTISELSRVQKALDIPLCDLLVDRNSLSRPVEERAKLVKAMKTAVAIREAKGNSRVLRLAKMLCEQLVDLMPELADVSGWPQFGARRGKSALGKALCQPIDMSNIDGDTR